MGRDQVFQAGRRILLQRHCGITRSALVQGQGGWCRGARWEENHIGSVRQGYRMARHGCIGGRGAPGTAREHMSFTQRVQEKQCHSFPLTQGSTSHFRSRVTLKILKLALKALSNPLYTVDTQYTSVDLAT